jgi:hypothetical protein
MGDRPIEVLTSAPCPENAFAVAVGQIDREPESYCMYSLQVEHYAARRTVTSDVNTLHQRAVEVYILDSASLYSMKRVNDGVPRLRTQTVNVSTLSYAQ